MNKDYIHFGDLARGRFNQQCQYASRYVNPSFQARGYPYLGEGLRFEGDPSDYHTLMIHQDDVEEFVKRYEEYRGSHS